MMKTVEVYIKNEEITILYRPFELDCTTYLGKWNIFPWKIVPYSSSKIKIIPEEDRKALEVAQTFSKQLGLTLKVYDTESLNGKARAWLKGVKKTPTIILGNKKIENVNEETLELSDYSALNLSKDPIPPNL